jgi:hypothetical protein
LRREFPGQGAENTAETCQQGATGAQILRVDPANTGTPSMRRLAVGSRASEQTSRRRPRCHPRPSPVSASQGLLLPLAASRPFLRCRGGFACLGAVLRSTEYTQSLVDSISINSDLSCSIRRTETRFAPTRRTDRLLLAGHAQFVHASRPSPIHPTLAR